MFDHHRKSPWFAEKYDPAPEFVQVRARVRKVGWRGRLDAFLLDLEAGKFDPDANEPDQEAESTKESTSNGEAAQLASDSSAVPASADEQKTNMGAEDEMQFNVEQEDEGGDANGKQQDDAKRLVNRGEELAVPPEGNQVMIRTIPPDIGRIKLEEVSHLIPFVVGIS